MGMFDKGNFGKCNCPHCRGGHADHDMNNGFSLNPKGSQYEVEDTMSQIDFNSIDPQDLCDQYIEAVLQCDSPQEVADVMYEFFDEVYVHAMAETYMGDIEAKIMGLKMLKEGFIEEDE